MNPFEGYRITSPFGWRKHPITGNRSFHTGIDLVKPHNSPIHSFTNGLVVYAGEGKAGTGLGGYGNVVVLRDTLGHLHLYAHLNSVSVRQSSVVLKGQEVGRQGTTGQSTGSHLHYEVRKRSTPSYGYVADQANQCFDPTSYLLSLVSKESKEENEPMKLSASDVSIIKQGINKFSKTMGTNGQAVINSPQLWLDKVDNGTLTSGDLAVLNLAILTRTVK